MDSLRSCYKSSMRLFSDRPDVLTPGQWFWCPEGAKVIPFQSRFVSQNWDPKHVEGNPCVGEIRGPRTWVNGACPPQYTGTHFCGSEEVWQNGILYADRPGLEIGDDGFPTCCPHAPMMGAELGFDTSAQAFQFVTASVSLGLKATAVKQVDTPCTGSYGMPSKLVVRCVSDGGCTGFAGQSVVATYDPTFRIWFSGPFAAGVAGGPYTAQTFCNEPGPNWRTEITNATNHVVWGANALPTVSPFTWSATDSFNGFSPCFGLNATFSVSES